VTKKEKTIIEFIIDNSSSQIDLKWKMNQYLRSGDLSFLGIRMKILNEKSDQRVSAKISKKM
jgi:hypothetical protein